MTIPTIQTSNGINNVVKGAVNATKTAHVAQHVSQAFHQAKVVNTAKAAIITQKTTAAIDNATATTGTHSAAALQTPAKPQPTPADISNLTLAFDQFINGDVDLLSDIGDYARSHPAEAPRIEQAYIDVWGKKLGEMGLGSWVDRYLGKIAEANTGTRYAETVLERLSRSINRIAAAFAPTPNSGSGNRPAPPLPHFPATATPDIPPDTPPFPTDVPTDHPGPRNIPH